METGKAEAVNLSVIFLLDGMPTGNEGCSVKTCTDRATGVYEVCDAETCRYLFTVTLCKKHGQQFVTGVAA